MRSPRGARLAGVAAGIRPGKPDAALFVSDHDPGVGTIVPAEG